MPLYTTDQLRGIGVETALDDTNLGLVNTLVTDRMMEYVEEAGYTFDTDAGVSRRVQLGLVRLYLVNEIIRETDIGDARISYRSVRIEESRLLRRLTGPAWQTGSDAPASEQPQFETQSVRLAPVAVDLVATLGLASGSSYLAQNQGPSTVWLSTAVSDPGDAGAWLHLALGRDFTVEDIDGPLWARTPAGVAVLVVTLSE